MDFRGYYFRYSEFLSTIKSVSSNGYTFKVGSNIFDITDDEYREFCYQYDQLSIDIGPTFKPDDWICCLPKNQSMFELWNFINNDSSIRNKTYTHSSLKNAPQPQYSLGYSAIPKQTPPQNFPSAPQTPPQPKRLCECGSWKLNAQDYSRNHSSWCPSFKP